MIKYTHFKETLADKGKVIPLEDVHNKLINKDSDYYTNLFWGDEDLVKFFNEHGSIKDYHGKVLTDRLIFDFDSVNNIDLARQDTRKVINKIVRFTNNKRIEEYMAIYFSGNKGFHLEVATDQEFTPDEAKSICQHFAEGCETFDTVIYSFIRAFRLPNTKHNKSGLYKIPLTPQQLISLSVEDIRSMAKAQAQELPTLTPLDKVDFKPLAVVKKPAFKPVIILSDDETGIRGLNTIDYSKCPKHTPRCFYALLRGVMVPGERSKIFFRLAAYLRNQGMTKEVAHNTLKGVARENTKLYPEAEPITKDEIWNQHIASAYGSSKWEQIPGASGTTEDNELIKKYCDAIKSECKCTFHNKAKSGGLVKIEEVSNSFQEFAENFDENVVLTGLSQLDMHMQIVAGTTTLLVGAAGSGKTTAALNIMELANANGQYTLFFSMDMHKHLVYQKLGVKCTNYEQHEIKDFYKNRDSQKIKEIREAIGKRYDKTIFDFSATATMEELRDKVIAAEQMVGQKIKLVVVDYASRISGPHSDRFSNAGYNALKSTEVAADTNAAWIFLCQISRQSGDGSTPLRSKRVAKESGDWEETASNVITMWRPFLGKADIHHDNIIKFYLAKNRMGQEVEFPVIWNGAKGLIVDWQEDLLQETLEDLKKRENDALGFGKKKKD